ncbi:unnamed protein product [Soboliphyme baturini]|uniref:RRM domain-containing protein n=1 Tax=Soboliphyme baturini TaxID=241478 RepID=A0A183IEY0_9BILA|nr:unnamed protein product [Soboliphyme baturini]
MTTSVETEHELFRSDVLGPSVERHNKLGKRKPALIEKDSVVQVQEKFRKVKRAVSAEKRKQHLRTSLKQGMVVKKKTKEEPADKSAEAIIREKIKLKRKITQLKRVANVQNIENPKKAKREVAEGRKVKTPHKKRVWSYDDGQELGNVNAVATGLAESSAPDTSPVVSLSFFRKKLKRRSSTAPCDETSASSSKQVQKPSCTGSKSSRTSVASKQRKFKETHMKSSVEEEPVSKAVAETKNNAKGDAEKLRTVFVGNLTLAGAKKIPTEPGMSRRTAILRKAIVDRVNAYVMFVDESSVKKALDL